MSALFTSVTCMFIALVWPSLVMTFKTFLPRFGMISPLAAVYTTPASCSGEYWTGVLGAMRSDMTFSPAPMVSS